MTKTQLRATCPACFAVQALRSGRLVAHGYRRPQAWHQNVGTCSGTGQPHFGTEAGRDYTAWLATQLRKSADRVEQDAIDVATGHAPVYATKRVAYGVNQEVVVDDPTARQRETYAAQLRYQADQMRKQAVEFDGLAAGWLPVAPVAVAVEEKAATIHFRASHYGHQHHACASSAMGARQYRQTTANPAEVTCERCKQRKAFVAATSK